MLIVQELTPPSKQEVYQLCFWFPRESLVNLGTFRTWGNRYGMWSFQLPPPMHRQESLVVTLEPEGGSAGPTGPMMLAVDTHLPSH